MADHQKIHPVAADVEAGVPPPTAPLMPRNSSRSDKGDPIEPQSQQQPQQQLGPPQRTIPVSHLKPPKKRSCCCRCACWTVSLLVALIIALAATAGILYLVFRPKIPKYSIDGLRVTEFNLANNMSLSATFNVNITMRNPNKRVGIYYEGGSHLSAWYADTKLCEGSLPKFYQGHRNTTLLDVPLVGRTENATALLTGLRDQQQVTGNVPLILRAKVPVRIKLGKLKLMKMKFRVRCRLVVDDITNAETIRISSSRCKFRFKL